ncbi:MAG: hypothetical protein ACOVQN_04415 [Exiguobacterium sp.]
MPSTNQALSILLLIAILAVATKYELVENFHKQLLETGSAQVTITLTPITFLAAIMLVLNMIVFVNQSCQTNVVIFSSAGLFIYIAYQVMISCLVFVK